MVSNPLELEYSAQGIHLNIAGSQCKVRFCWRVTSFQTSGNILGQGCNTVMELCHVGFTHIIANWDLACRDQTSVESVLKVGNLMETVVRETLSCLGLTLLRFLKKKQNVLIIAFILL